MRHHSTRERILRAGPAILFTRVLGFTLLFPLSLAFFTRLEGRGPKEAVHNAFAYLGSFTPLGGIWLTVAVLALAVLAYLLPVLRFQRAEAGTAAACGESCTEAVSRLDNLEPFLILVSTVLFAIPAIGKTSSSDTAHFFATPEAYELVQSMATGFLAGVGLSVNLGNILFPARRRAVLLSPGARLKPKSLYKKIFLIISALVVFTVFQLFSSSGYFFRLGAEAPGLAGGFPRLNSAQADQLLPQGARDQSLTGVLSVLYVRLAFLLVIVAELFWQIKLMFLRPVLTILKRLTALNTGTQPGGPEIREIEIVQNDEFSRVYDEINKLIRRQASQLEVSRGRLGSVTANAADPIIVYDRDCRILEVNPAAERYFGYKASEAASMTLEGLLGTAGEGKPACADAASFFAQASGGFARFSASAKDGRALMFEAHVSHVDSDEETTYTAVLRDVLAQAELEESLKAARRAAENANRLKSEFLANMSHELRTPLNAVLGFTQLLAADKTLGERQLEKVGVISRSGEHLLALINDILDISKIEAGKMESHLQVFDLETFLDDMKEMFALRCRQKGLALYVEQTSELPRWVSGDLGKLRQVIINLVGNAVKFTAEGGVGITVGMEGGKVRFAVIDSGRGIPADEIELVMQPFTQSTITDHEGGTGLGLAISTRYVEMMGGSLEVKSEVGKGSTFTFALDLPAAERPVAEAGSDEAPIAVKAGSAATVLIVDDKETNRLVLKEMLEAVGFQTLEAADGREAVDLALERGPAVVFMDIRMPVMDGYEAVRELKSRPEGQAMRVFALTASAFRHDEEKIREAGFDGFLAKPFKRSALFQLIRTRTEVELEYEEAAPGPAQAAPDAASVDFGAAREAIGGARLERLSGLALVGDYSGVRELAREVEALAPGVAALLRHAAASFDDRALGELLARLGATSS